ncbi:MAG: hypothetical protein ACKOCB_03075 [Planctomycetia bacterium]
MSPSETTFPFADPTPTGPGAEGTVVVSMELPLERLLTAREVALTQRVQRFLPVAGEVTPDLRRALHTGLKGLAGIVLAMEAYPSLRERRMLGTRVRSLESLMQGLIERGEHGLEWALPTKAVLSRTYAIAKVNFFTSIAYCVDACKHVADREPLLRDLAGAVEEAVYTRLAEELYTGFVTSRTTQLEIKTRAAENLVAVWEGRVRFATDRFCPLLRSAWAARTHAPRAFGTMMGASEMFHLLFADCDPRFVDWFTQHTGKSEQVQAFEEFLFDLPYESLERVRQRMSEEGLSVVGPREVERLLGMKDGELRPLLGDPKALYSSYRRRRVKAQYRTSMASPGPKRTAESYLLEALLSDESRARAFEAPPAPTVPAPLPPLPAAVHATPAPPAPRPAGTPA